MRRAFASMVTLPRLLPLGLFGVFLGALAERFDRGEVSFPRRAADEQHLRGFRHSGWDPDSSKSGTSLWPASAIGGGSRGDREQYRPAVLTCDRSQSR